MLKEKLICLLEGWMYVSNEEEQSNLVSKEKDRIEDKLDGDGYALACLE